MWERGLKQNIALALWIAQVAPHVGAWIETRKFRFRALHHRSLPMWERGLKPIENYDKNPDKPSLPMWERGLKLIISHRRAVLVGRSPCGSVD